MPRYFFACHVTGPLYSNSLGYPSLSDMLLLQCPQDGRTPLDEAEYFCPLQKESTIIKEYKRLTAGVLRRHGAKRGAEL